MTAHPCRPIWKPPAKPPLVNTVGVHPFIGRFDVHTRQNRTPVSTDDDNNPEMIDYLSLAWIRELSREVRESEELAELATRHSIGVTQVVNDGPDGDVTYHLQVADGTAVFGAGVADPEDVKMQQSYETAVAVATGALNAQEAFVTGKILLFGDREALMQAQEVFAALDTVFNTVRTRTRYSD